MNTISTNTSIEKLNNLIKSIEANKQSKRHKRAIANFDNIDLSDLNIELIVGSKVSIQSEIDNKINFTKISVLENHLKSILEYKNIQNKSPKHKANFDDLTLDIEVETNRKYLIPISQRIKKTPSDIKRDITITLLENLKTSVFLYKNLDKEIKYKADFDDLTLDINLEYKKTYQSQVNNSVDIPLDTIGDKKKEKKKNKVNILEEKLINIEKFRKLKHQPKVDNISKDIDIGVTLTKSGEQVISLNKKNRINKLKQLLESINSYKEKRDGLH